MFGETTAAVAATATAFITLFFYILWTLAGIVGVQADTQDML